MGGEFDEEEERINARRAEYLKSITDKQIEITLTDFFFVEDGIYPEEFELVLVIDKQGELSAGCMSIEEYYAKDHPEGLIRQSRGGVIFFEDIIAWKPIDCLKVL